MKTVDPSFFAMLQNAPEDGIVPRWFVSFIARTWPDGAGKTTKQTVSFWSGDAPVTVEVRSLIDGQISARVFEGSVDLDTGESVSTSSLEVNTRNLNLTMLNPAVEAAARGLDLRAARVEIWIGLLDPRTRQLSSMPENDYLGVVDGASIQEGGEDGNGEVLEVRLVNDAVVNLTRPNPAKSSAEEQKKRKGPNGEVDNFGKYAGPVENWNEPWGEK
ncbi:hypothetical protein [Rhizobium sp. Leaf341]|uniref:hypothetical protein n=1 Tax=Rhizobium sp. Leaf341 TaxID=1736344 RepID=UPI0007156E08|nr:hypothetical protein [Rhizobium sp. Leaf341]KQR75743.1 hypothetical protein ASG03_18910 [Rhizobium sp. Leaf341]